MVSGYPPSLLEAIIAITVDVSGVRDAWDWETMVYSVINMGKGY